MRNTLSENVSKSMRVLVSSSNVFSRPYYSLNTRRILPRDKNCGIHHAGKRGNMWTQIESAVHEMMEEIDCAIQKGITAENPQRLWNGHRPHRRVRISPRAKSISLVLEPL